MSGNKLKTARVVSVVAATVISLACGTNVDMPTQFVPVHTLIVSIVCVLGMGARVRREDEALLNSEQFDRWLSAPQNE